MRLEENVVGRQRASASITQRDVHFPETRLEIRDQKTKLFDTGVVGEHFASVGHVLAYVNNRLLPPCDVYRRVSAIFQEADSRDPVHDT